ncbi:DUF952 domain-containing protein [Amorphus orientalis]|uniref:Uncharacterized protein (DUF952 family) n=1 Tax=Amorphus orientalis TaxID=649198 RepID=A0AAE3VKN8_9HYPH|nr:DUF952 domain-containing protein [Amorphus orientalis]MDQ0313790.1 uncharacterized protein (DUF952 family) [Amorphus orientalis]
MHASTVYKIVDKDAWRTATAEGVYHGAPVDLADGFIHFSAAHQVEETASKHFRDQDGLLLVAVPTEALGEALKWEPSRGGDLFPHLYGDLPVDAAAWVRPLPLTPTGHRFPDLAS